MQLRNILVLASSVAATFAAPFNSSLSFGKHYAVLNCDLIVGTVEPITNTTQGKHFINSTKTWIDAVHQKHTQPLTFFTTIYFSNPSDPQLKVPSPFSSVLGDAPPLVQNSSFAQFYPGFDVGSEDIVLVKTRYYAGSGNSLEDTLRSQRIDTVILSGLSLSEVILSTLYRLFDLDYNLYIISDTVLQTPDYNITGPILDGIIPIMKQNVISLDQALKALANS